MSFIVGQFYNRVASFELLPDAAASQNAIFQVDSVCGATFAFFVSDGAYWRPLNGYLTLYKAGGYSSNFVASITCTALAERQYFVTPETLTIPRGLFCPQMKLRVRLLFKSDPLISFSYFVETYGALQGYQALTGIDSQGSFAGDHSTMFYIDAALGLGDYTKISPLGTFIARALDEINNRVGFNWQNGIGSTQNNNAESLELKISGITKGTPAPSATLKLYGYEIAIEA